MTRAAQMDSTRMLAILDQMRSADASAVVVVVVVLEVVPAAEIVIKLHWWLVQMVEAMK